MKIYGSSNLFRISFYGSFTYGGIFYLENTTKIVWDCDCTNCDYISNCRSSKLYTGLSLDVTLLCGDGSCNDLTLYSDLSLNQYLLYTLWNIDCDIASSLLPEFTCKNFVLIFKNGEWCIYYNSTSTNCTNFPAISELTVSPTTDPTSNRSPTSDSTINPTRVPLIDLIKNPTSIPTMDPIISYTTLFFCL